MPSVWKRFIACLPCFSRPSTRDEDEQASFVLKVKPVDAPPISSMVLSQDSIDADKLLSPLELEKVSLQISAGIDYQPGTTASNVGMLEPSFPTNPGAFTVDTGAHSPAQSPTASADNETSGLITIETMPLDKSQPMPAVSFASRHQPLLAVLEKSVPINRSLQSISKPSSAEITAAPPSPQVPCVHKRFPSFAFARCQNQRSSMQDYLDVSQLPAVTPDDQSLTIYTVLDGHNSEVAAELAMDLLPRSILKRHSQGLQTALLKGFAATEAYLYRDKYPGTLGGTTALVIIHTPTTLHIANLGDCRAVLGRTTHGVHSAVDLTQDHKPKLEQDRGVERLRGEVLYRDDEGWYLNREGEGGEVQRLGVSRSLGDFDMPALKYQTSSGQWAGPLTAVPELSNYDIQDADELLVIASDGLWDKVSSHQAMLWARDHLKQDASTVESCAKMLMQTAIQMGSLDNISVIVVQLSEIQPDLAAAAADTRPAHLRARFRRGPPAAL